MGYNLNTCPVDPTARTLNHCILSHNAHGVLHSGLLWGCAFIKQHLGHCQVLRTCVALGEALTCLISFHPHSHPISWDLYTNEPQSLTEPQRGQIMNLHEKLSLSRQEPPWTMALATNVIPLSLCWHFFSPRGLLTLHFYRPLPGPGEYPTVPLWGFVKFASKIL